MRAKKNNNKGFSILEVAILLVIAAVLAATTLPNIQGSLKSSSISVAAMAGQFDSGVKLARAQWFSNGQSSAGRIEGFVDGQVWSGERGWPVGYQGAEAPAVLSATTCASLWNGIMQDKDAPRAATDKTAKWQAKTGRTDECQYVAMLGEQQRVISYSTRSGKVSYQ